MQAQHYAVTCADGAHTYLCVAVHTRVRQTYTDLPSACTDIRSVGSALATLMGANEFKM